MPETLILFIKYYFFFISAFIFFFTIGHFCLKFLSRSFSVKGFYTNIFLKSVTGIVASVIIYSYIITDLKTINIGFIFIVAFLIWELRLYKNENKKKIDLYTYDG